jgi:UMF1 family MFS transporter
MLAVVAAPADRGRVSSLAVLGNFVGAALALAASSLVILTVAGHADIPVARRSLVVAGLLYALFALPFALFVRDRGGGAEPAAPPHERSGPLLVGTFRRLLAVPGVGRMMLGKLLYSDAMSAINTFAVVYIKRVGDFSGLQINLILVSGLVSAAITAPIAGTVVSRVGPKRVLLWVVPSFALSLWVTAGFGAPWTVWVIGPTLGAAQATVWTVDRLLLLQLTPPHRRGEFFGVFNLFSRASGSVGPLLLWSGLIYLLHDSTGWLSDLDASRVALATLGLSAALGAVVIRSLPDRWRELQHEPA